ncbi:MAG: hypothetical protein ABFS34_10425 [Gemmatimonadota bacterium]
MWQTRYRDLAPIAVGSNREPHDAPGSLTDDEVYSAVAFLLYLNDIIPEDQALDAVSLPAVEMPAQNDFVVDDRLESTSVR